MLALSQVLIAQSYSIWRSGDSTDVVTNHQQAIVLAGGGGDHDGAMRWMLRKADGGDIVVIRTSGSDGYNPYFFDELDVDINSVITIRFDSAKAAFDQFIINQIRGAEVLFIAGGDQTVYQQYWQNTPVQEAINYLINEKKATVGGTSAGMAILGEYYYTPNNLGVTSEEALNDPFHPYMDEINIDSFIDAPYLTNVITDTHFDQRERAGRTVTFLARIVGLNLLPKAITANEYTAVGIDSDGLAWVFGDYPNYDDFAYFLQTNCDIDNNEPETLNSGDPLLWSLDGQAIKVYKVAGSNDGVRYFDLNSWQDGRGGTWEDWSAINGVIFKTLDANAPCLVASLADKVNLIIPNPIADRIQVTSNRNIQKVRLFRIDGSIILERRSLLSTSAVLNVPEIQPGVYVLQLQFGDGSQLIRKLIKE